MHDKNATIAHLMLLSDVKARISAMYLAMAIDALMHGQDTLFTVYNYTGTLLRVESFEYRQNAESLQYGHTVSRTF